MTSTTGAGLHLRGLCAELGGREILRGIDLEVAPGEVIGVVGRSGSGKSTLLRVLAGLAQPSKGELEVGAPPVIMFQEPRLLPWRSVLQNVMLGVTPPDPRAARAALEEVGLADRASDYPSVLSGGQRQRVALARALMHRPALLLLDEPFGALDALTRISAQNLVQALWLEHGFTAVLVTHDVEEAVLLADHVLVIEDGRVVYREPVELARPRVRSSLEVGRITARVLSAIFGDAGEGKPATVKSDVRQGAVATPRATGLWPTVEHVGVGESR